MSQLKVSLLDKRLIQHLTSGGSITDETSAKIATEIVFNTWCAADVSTNATNLGLSMAHLVAIYMHATQSLGPNPLIQHGGKIIATSLVYMDFPKFPAFLQIITQYGELRPDTPGDLELIASNACAAVRSIFDEANARRWQPSMSSGGGCAGVAVASVGAIGAIVMAVYRGIPTWLC